MNTIQHDNSISVIRVTAMMMIVFYHCLCYNAGIWDSFNTSIHYNSIIIAEIHNIACVGLDSFVLISGMLYYRIGITGKYDNLKLFLKNKTERLLAPYIIWGLILCIIFKGSQPPIRLIYGISHLWFLLMLFEVFVIAIFIKKHLEKLTIIQSCLALTMLLIFDVLIAKVGLIPNDGHGRILFALQYTLDYFPIFFIGMMIEKFKLYKKIAFGNNVSTLLILLLFVISSLPFIIHIPLSRLIQWIPTSLLIVIYYRLFFKWQFPFGGNRYKILNLFDKYSLPIYIIHHILIFFILDYIPVSQAYMSVHYITSPILLFLIVLLLSLGISYSLSFLPKAKYFIGVNK